MSLTHDTPVAKIFQYGRQPRFECFPGPRLNFSCRESPRLHLNAVAKFLGLIIYLTMYRKTSRQTFRFCRETSS